ncbi:MAG: ABC-F family ATP-binding cassette domain-containing protein [Candidatus Binatia bacterium]|nr:ABC-F family ATP-binding cassette domain-containing protein [Candidatus Binatia bacterium]
MISLENVTKGFGARTLIQDATLTLGPGDRIGIVGPNGAGKSTLLALLLGHELPDDGAIRRSKGLTLGHLPQEILTAPEETVLETATRPSGRLAGILEDLERLPSAIEAATTDTERETLSTHLAEAHAVFAEVGGHDREARARRILAGLGFRTGEPERRLGTFSGGYVMRAELARLLLDLPDVLLLDEPTNHLDLESVLWLQGFLAQTRSILIIISHDRAFLDATIQSILEVDRMQLTRYVGSYGDYVRERAARRAQLEASAKAQDRRIKQTERFIERFRAKSTKATQVQSRIKALEKEDRIEIASESARVHLRFPQPERTSDIALELEKVRFGYGTETIYDGIDFRLERGEKTVLVGPNGAGKSTLLKLLGGVLEPSKGERKLGLRATIGYYAQHRHDLLDLGQTVLENARSAAPDQTETFIRTLLGSFLFSGDDVFKNASVLSGGEKSRLALARILLAPPSVLLMDEPTTHLDIPSVDALIDALREYEGSLCFVSHDVHFIRRLARRVVRIEPGTVNEYPGDWDYYTWKHAQEAELLAAGTSAGGGPADEGADGERSGRGKRAERRAAAEARNDLARRTQPLRRELTSLETGIEALETEKGELESRLADPETYEDSDFDVGGAQRRHAEVDRDLTAKMDRWVEVQDALEAAEASAET